MLGRNLGSRPRGWEGGSCVYQAVVFVLGVWCLVGDSIVVGAW